MTDGSHARPLRLVVVDDHEVVRQGLVALLDRRDGFQVVAEAGTVAEAIEQARSPLLRPGLDREAGERRGHEDVLQGRQLVQQLEAFCGKFTSHSGDASHVSSRLI